MTTKHEVPGGYITTETWSGDRTMHVATTIHVDGTEEYVGTFHRQIVAESIISDTYAKGPTKREVA